jgi:galactitol-specific phosphotransferase system IIB component
MFDQLQFERAWSEKFMSEVYKDFLTTDEIQSMLNNKDIWMTSEQVLSRIETILKKLQEQKDATI